MTIRRVLAVACLTIAAVCPSIGARGATDEVGFVRINQSEEVWKNPFGVGVEVATMCGDLSQKGIYVLRIKWPPGIMSKPHRHPEDRHVVVLSGTGTPAQARLSNPARPLP